MADRPPRPGSGLLWTGTSSVAVAALGLVALVVVGRWQGPAAYADFAVLWGIFFGIGGVFAGLQQEVTRSVSVTSGPGAASLVPPTVVLGLTAGSVAVVVLHRIGRADATTTLAVAVGLAGVAGMTMLSGVLAARSDWPGLAAVLTLDALVRAIAIVAITVSGRSWLLPVGIASGALSWLVLASGHRYRSALTARVDVEIRGLLRRAVLAMAATGCAALLVAGLPVLVAVSRGGALDDGAGSVLAALVILRSGLLVPLYGFRPVILRGFLRGAGASASLPRIWATCLLVGGSWTVAAVVAGPRALRLLLGGSFVVTRAECAALAAGSVGIMLLVVSGLALVARDQHVGATLGWLTALLVTCVVIPVPSEPRVSVTLAALVGPWAGAAVQVWLLRRGNGAESGGARSSSVEAE